MQLWCRRCGTSFVAPATGLVPCPSCGTTDVSGRSPLAATTERSSLGIAAPSIQAGSADGATVPGAGMAAQGATVLTPTPQPVAHPEVNAYPMQPVMSAAAGPYPAAPSHPYAPAYQAAPVPFPGAPSYPMVQPHPMSMVQPVPYPHAYVQAPPQVVVIQNHIQPYAASAPMVYQRRKDAGVATLLSFMLPGAGQLYNGQVGKGLAFMFVSFFVNMPLMFLGIGVFTWLATWVWSMVDAHRTAESINRGELVV